jgi:hypothetical protein
MTLGLLWSMMSSGMRRTEGQYIRQSTVKCLNDLASRMGSCASLSTSSWKCLDVSIFSLEFLVIYGTENFVKKSTRWSEQAKAVWDMTGRFDFKLFPNSSRYHRHLNQLWENQKKEMNWLPVSTVRMRERNAAWTSDRQQPYTSVLLLTFSFSIIFFFG